ncbi:GNAT family N-acetyltransferase [Skermania piniformis]|uniref:GNAT family N-acetyltransferase n=1 Tax=Skermania pinensis TaxID=39122 RepID=A0ABX8S4J6_9ACTN|nr:GNAT family N-acetyltransferase [Skermania piniformis]QXQ12758.1 GNAT family N-acetyltransferase [Skermania piniformis]
MTDARPAVVRPAEPTDFPGIDRLTTAVYIGEGYVESSSAYAAVLADTAARAAAAEVVVAECDGVVVGSLTIARPGTPFAPLATPDELEFRMLAVDRRARATGVGTALVRHVLDLARHDGYARVVLGTTATMVAARRIYDRLGFVHRPDRDLILSNGVPITVLSADVVPPQSDR